jgi:hypothetical protein
MDQQDINAWKAKFPFLESIIADCSNLFMINEETSNLYLDQCYTHGYFSAQGETTTWIWWGAKDGVLRYLPKDYYQLKDAMTKESFDYLITCEHITTDTWADDTIRIHKLTGAK